MSNKYSHVRGFNYEPSYASTVYESWRQFNAETWELEFRRGKEYFPGINTMRLWLDWGAWVQDSERFKKNLDKALELVERICKAKAVVCLMNRWHNTFLDAGGLYIDHFMPNWGWVKYSEGKYTPYLKDIVGTFKDDDRILIWDYCNEPLSYGLPNEQMKEIEQREFEWLSHIYQVIKEIGPKHDVGTSVHNASGLLSRVEPIEDVLLIHPYYISKRINDEDYIQNVWHPLLDEYEKVSRESGKPLLITECCWGGGIDWQTRVAIMKQELGEFSKRKIGFLPHALHHSLVADLHQPEFGPVSWKQGDTGFPGSMEFIDVNGLLRPGHEVFNEF